MSSRSGRPAASVSEKACWQANAPAAMVWKPAFSRLAHSSARELSKLRLPKVTTGTASAPFPAKPVCTEGRSLLGTLPA